MLMQSPIEFAEGAAVLQGAAIQANAENSMEMTNVLLLGLLLLGLWLLTASLVYFVIQKYRKKIEGMKSLEQLNLLKDELPEMVYEKQLAEISITQTNGVLILLSSVYTGLLFSVTFGATLAFIMYLN